MSVREPKYGCDRQVSVVRFLTLGPSMRPFEYRKPRAGQPETVEHVSLRQQYFSKVTLHKQHPHGTIFRDLQHQREDDFYRPALQAFEWDWLRKKPGRHADSKYPCGLFKSA